MEDGFCHTITSTLGAYTPERILVTGGAGFIGSALVRYLLRETDATVINVDKLTYAGNLETVADCMDDPRHQFIQLDIVDEDGLDAVFTRHQPDAVVHLAAESHVDRSIAGPAAFVQTNIVGTFHLLESVRRYWQALPSPQQEHFRFLQVSTDEVYGSAEEGEVFTEDSPYRPNSPYAASKASADHLVRAWYRTYCLPIMVVNCANAYGPWQYPEKLIPVIVLNALAEEPINVYGTGENIRDWMYVEDHVDALYLILSRVGQGSQYNIGANNTWANIDIVRKVCRVLDSLYPRKGGGSYTELIRFVADRPGHDFRYSLDTRRVGEQLDWTPKYAFEDALEQTVRWYGENRGWCRNVIAGQG